MTNAHRFISSLNCSISNKYTAFIVPLHPDDHKLKYSIPDSTVLQCNYGLPLPFKVCPTAAHDQSLYKMATIRGRTHPLDPVVVAATLLLSQARPGTHLKHSRR